MKLGGKKMSNKLTEIIYETNTAVLKANNLFKSIKDDKGLYNWLQIGLDMYIQNNPEPTKQKPNIIKYFFEDLDDAVGYLKKDYRCK